MNQRSNAIDRVVKSILKRAGVLGAKELEAWKAPHVEIRKLAQTDYGKCLRRKLTVEQVKELVSRATDIWPRFNQAIIGPPSEKLFSRAAGALQLHLKSAPYNSLALYGFYVDPADRPAKTSHLRQQRPSPVGHGYGFLSRSRPSFLHRDLETEINRTAILLRCRVRRAFARLGGTFRRYNRQPRRVPSGSGRGHGARHKPQDGSRKDFNDTVFSAIRRHMKKSYGFDFSSKFPPGQNLQYLAGMIHYAKLRIALLQEYGI